MKKGPELYHRILIIAIIALFSIFVIYLLNYEPFSITTITGNAVWQSEAVETDGNSGQEQK